MFVLAKDIILLIIEYVKSSWPFWKDFLVIFVGLLAYLVYYRQKRDERRSAATMVVCQIDIIQKRVSSLKDDRQRGSIAVFHSKTIINENLWEKHKHKLIKTLTTPEYDLVQQFFDQAVQLEDARKAVIANLNNNWNCKTSALQDRIAEINLENNQKNLQKKIEQFVHSFEPMGYTFDPRQITLLLETALENQIILSGTTAYQKLHKQSYRH